MTIRPPGSRPGNGSAGFALIATIWALGLITLLGTAAIVGARYRVAESSTNSATTRAALAAESAVNLTLFLLLQEPQTLHASAPRFPLRCTLPGGERAFILVEDEAGKIDLNTATPQLLTLLFSRLAGNPNDGVRIAERIVQYRQASTAESAARGQAPSLPSKTAPVVEGKPLQTVAKERTNLAADGFVSILQLDQAVELPPSLFRAALPFITVHSRQADLSLEAVSPRLRRLLNIPAPAAAATLATNSSLNFTIRADVATADGARFIREAAVSFGSGDRPFEIREWRRGSIDPLLEPAHRMNVTLPDCLRNAGNATSMLGSRN